MNLKIFTREFLLDVFHYDKETGILFWKTHSKCHQFLIGKVAGSISKKKTDNSSYIRVYLFNKPYSLHRLIWFIEKNEWSEMIDHLDGNGLNNRIENLRNVNNRLNQQNRSQHRQGKLVGATWRKNQGFWTSQITINKKRKHLGCFLTEQDAHERYKQELKNRGLT